MSQRKVTRARDNLESVFVKPTEENLFLTGLIVSDSFMAGIIHVVEHRYFKSPHIRMVAKWAIDYYREFGTTAKEHIQEVFEVEKRNGKLEDTEIIENLLNVISAQYADKEFNSGYLLPKMINYIRERVVYLAMEDAEWHLKKHNVDDAWASLGLIKEVSQKISPGFSFLNDFDERFENWYYSSKEEIMRLPGALGSYMAPLRRKKLIAFIAPPKRGKSWWLLYMAYIAITQRLNVAFFSLEMSEEEVEERIAMMMTGHEFGSGEESYKIPVMDCRYNQDGSCDKPCRTGFGEAIIDSGSTAPPMFEDTPHTPCTECRKDWSKANSAFEYSDYLYSPWMEVITKPKLSAEQITRHIDNFKMHFGKNSLKIFTYRIGQATVDDLEADLDSEALLSGWVPDVVIVDYADITKKDKSLGDKRHQLSDIWENLSGMAKERNVLCFTASQGNRGSAGKEALSVEDIAEDFSKVMIVDGLIAINEYNGEKEKTKKDKYWQRQSLHWLAHRYKKDLREWEKCVTVNALDIGQPCLDSEIIE